MGPCRLARFRFDLRAPIAYDFRRRRLFCTLGHLPGIGDDRLALQSVRRPSCDPRARRPVGRCCPHKHHRPHQGRNPIARQKKHRHAEHGFLIGLLVSMWSANSGVSALFDALNVVHGETEERSLLQFYATTFAITLGAVVYGLIAIIGVLPMAFRFLRLGEQVQNFEAIFRWAATLLLVMIWLSVVYRVGPSRSDAKWRWVTWGSGLAAILLVVASMVFTWYLAEFNSYERLYGSLGAVVGFMTWLWISIVVVLLGAEVDAAIESKSAGRSAAAPD